MSLWKIIDLNFFKLKISNSGLNDSNIKNIANREYYYIKLCAK
jgi:hypothetical protein